MTMIVDLPPQREAPLPAGAQWPPQGKWTYEDYCCLPEDGRIYEILDR